MIDNNKDKIQGMGTEKDIIVAVEECVAACAEKARKLIDESQPVKFF